MSGSEFSGRDEDAVEDSDDDADDPMDEDGPRSTRKRGALAATVGYKASKWISLSPINPRGSPLKWGVPTTTESEA